MNPLRVWLEIERRRVEEAEPIAIAWVLDDLKRAASMIPEGPNSVLDIDPLSIAGGLFCGPERGYVLSSCVSPKTYSTKSFRIPRLRQFLALDHYVVGFVELVGRYRTIL